MTTNDEQYVPSEARVCIDYCNAAIARKGPGGAKVTMEEADQAFDRFLARVRRDAWTEGCRAAEQYYKRTVVGVPGSDPIPAPVNPHEETP